MAEENDAPKGGTEGGNEGGDGFKPITSQEQLNRLIGERINSVKSQYADYDELKKKASAYDEVENKSKSELQKEREAREAAEKKATSLEQAQLRLDVGLAKGLTPSQARRLVGSTKEELEADADAFLADIGGVKKAAPDPKKLRSGAKGGDDAGLSGKERAAEALRQLRAGSH